MFTYIVYFILFISYIDANPTIGKDLTDADKRKPDLKKDYGRQVAGSVAPYDELTMAKIVGEVLEHNVQHYNQDKQTLTPESEHLIKITQAKKGKKSKKLNRSKAKKSDELKKKQKGKKNNKNPLRKRKYPKKYNPKKHGIKKKYEKKRSHIKTKAKKMV